MINKAIEWISELWYDSNGFTGSKMFLPVRLEMTDCKIGKLKPEKRKSINLKDRKTELPRKAGRNRTDNQEEICI